VRVRPTLESLEDLTNKGIRHEGTTVVTDFTAPPSCQDIDVPQAHDGLLEVEMPAAALHPLARDVASGRR
jgi:hypothetical protein